MPVTHLSARNGRIDVTLDGVTFTRSESDAARRGAARRVHLDWDQVTGADVQTTRKGRAVIRVGVDGAPLVEGHREDPHAIKALRSQADIAKDLVRQINDEVAARRRWRQHAQP